MPTDALTSVHLETEKPVITPLTQYHTQVYENIEEHTTSIYRNVYLESEQLKSSSAKSNSRVDW